MNAVLRSAITDIAIGAFIQGGYFAGAVAIDDKPYGLVVAPRADGEFKSSIWIKDYKDVPAASSWFDGLANTKAMADAGSAIAKKAIAAAINEYTDWYIGAVDEVEICYRAFKPTTDTNSRYARSGINLSAIPPTWPYTADAPAQTVLEAFRKGGPEAFASESYWTSTQHPDDSGSAYNQRFDYGDQNDWSKDSKLRVRLVRRFAL